MVTRVSETESAELHDAEGLTQLVDQHIDADDFDADTVGSQHLSPRGTQNHSPPRCRQGRQQTFSEAFPL